MKFLLSTLYIIFFISVSCSSYAKCNFNCSEEKKTTSLIFEHNSKFNEKHLNFSSTILGKDLGFGHRWETKSRRRLKEWNISIVKDSPEKARLGTSYLRFETREGHCTATHGKSGWDDCKKGRNRAEIQSKWKNEVKPNRDFWHFFSLKIPSSIEQKKGVKTTVLILSIVLPPLISMISFGLTSKELQKSKGNQIEVVVVQPNYDSYQDFGGMSGTEEVLDSLFSLSLVQKKSETELIVWPENAIDKPIQMDSWHARRVADSARVWQTNFIIGTGLYTLYPDQAPDLYRSNINGVRYNVFNSTLFADTNGHLSRYDKAQLVPFVERFPFVEFLNKVDIFKWVDWGEVAGFGLGNKTSMIKSPSGFISPGLVCYDSVFPSWNQAFVREGAQILTIITNDGWWGNSSGHIQHFAYARLRAIEFRRWVVRSANNGTSGIISPDGSVNQKTKYWTRTSFSADVPLRNDLSFYTRWGDWLSMLCFFLVFLSVGYGWVTRKRS